MKRTPTLRCGRALHYFVDLPIQTDTGYTEPVPLNYGKQAAKYPWIYEYFFYNSSRDKLPVLAQIALIDPTLFTYQGQ